MFARPRIVVSKCLGFDACRYNGAILHDDLVNKLIPFVDFIPVCPEVEIGLGVPRNPIRIVVTGGEKKLMQPDTRADVTDKMESFTDRFFSSLEEIDGFILKSRSPSCGIKDVKAYPGIEKSGSAGKTAGFFGGKAVANFTDKIVEDEKRLTNYRIRQHFLSRIFAMANFREVKRSGAMRKLVKFHADNKYLLMSYSQKELKSLGAIAANHGKRGFAEVISEYENHLDAALRNAPKCASIINVLMHVQGYFPADFSREEKKYLAEVLENYRNGKIPLSSVIILWRSLVVRFKNDYLAGQAFFAPFPEELADLSDSAQELGACGRPDA